MRASLGLSEMDISWHPERYLLPHGVSLGMDETCYIYANVHFACSSTSGWDVVKVMSPQANLAQTVSRLNSSIIFLPPHRPIFKWQPASHHED